MIENYYNQRFIHYLMAGYVKDRTLDFIIPRRIDPEGIAFRYRRVASPTALDFFFKKFQVSKKPFNIYASLARVDTKNFPIMSMQGIKAREQLKYINEHFKEFVTGYDFKLDIDHENLDVAHAEALKIKRELDKKNIPYWILFSGNKGFNFTIDDRHIPSRYNPANRPETHSIIAEHLKDKLKLETLDLSVYTLGRVFKVPYGIAREKNLVALPLSDDQFDNFHPDEYSIKTILRTVKLMNRGLLEREGGIEEVGKWYDSILKTGFMQKIKGAFS